MSHKSSVLAFSILNLSDGSSFGGTLYVSADDISYVISGAASGYASSTSLIETKHGDSHTTWLVSGTASNIVGQIGASEMHQITFYNQPSVQPYIRLSEIQEIYPSNYDSSLPSGVVRIRGNGFDPQDIASSDEASLVAALGNIVTIS